MRTNRTFRQSARYYRPFLILGAVAAGILWLASLAHGQSTPPPAKPGVSLTVYLTEHGKTFHRTPECMALARTTKILVTTRPQAEAHGLKPCGICWREKKPAKPGNSGWAKEVRNAE